MGEYVYFPDDNRTDLKFWSIVASQDVAWIGHCEHLTEQAERQLQAWGIATSDDIEF